MATVSHFGNYFGDSCACWLSWKQLLSTVARICSWDCLATVARFRFLGSSCWRVSHVFAVSGAIVGDSCASSLSWPVLSATVATFRLLLHVAAVLGEGFGDSCAFARLCQELVVTVPRVCEPVVGDSFALSLARKLFLATASRVG